jgi:tetratricopeptide (TPR) repeat protein
VVTLVDVLQLVRDGKPDLAAAVIEDLPIEDRPRALLAIAYRRGDIPRAVELAGVLWQQRRWDPTVAAVLARHGRGSLQASAAAALGGALEALDTDVAAIAAELEADPGSLATWRRMVRALVHSGRVREAVEGVVLALQEGHVGRELWAMLGTELLVAGAPNTATVADLGVQWYPSDPEVHALAALLHVASGSLDQAAELATRAIRLNASSGFAYVARASVLAASGRHDEAKRSLERGVALGIDPAFGGALGAPDE